MIIVILSGCSTINIRGTDFEKRAIQLQMVIAEIQSALALVNDEVEKKTNLELKNAILEANTEIGKSKEGEAGLWVVSGKASKENKSADKVIIELTPITGRKLIDDTFDETLSKRLAMLIVSAVEGVSNAGDNKYPMRVDKLTIEMAIITKKTGSAGMGVELEVLPVSFVGKGGYWKSNSDTLKLEFGQKKEN